jgi:hypothetical protein
MKLKSWKAFCSLEFQVRGRKRWSVKKEGKKIEKKIYLE